MLLKMIGIYVTMAILFCFYYLSHNAHLNQGTVLSVVLCWSNDCLQFA